MLQDSPGSAEVPHGALVGFHLGNRLCAASSSLRFTLAGEQHPRLSPDLLNEAATDVPTGPAAC